ncbi:hypothetical protein EGX44_02925 [Yersinia pseudotuberculosis]|nr:hypothetical protein EGX44_02925 [Yersinia pseudotuberculosis]
MNVAYSGLEEAKPIDGGSNERSQRTCSLKYEVWRVIGMTKEGSTLYAVVIGNEWRHFLFKIKRVVRIKNGANGLRFYRTNIMNSLLCRSRLCGYD